MEVLRSFLRDLTVTFDLDKFKVATSQRVEGLPNQEKGSNRRLNFVETLIKHGSNVITHHLDMRLENYGGLNKANKVNPGYRQPELKARFIDNKIVYRYET